MEVGSVQRVPISSRASTIQGTNEVGKQNKSTDMAEHMKKEDKQQDFSEKELIRTIEKANQKFEIYDKRLEFSIHEKTKQIMVKIINTENNEVIKEIPPEKILDMVANLMELAGIVVDEKA